MKHYNVTGMSCAACSARVEKAVSSLPDVTACAVNLLTHSMSVEGSVSAAEVIGAVEKAGYGASERIARSTSPTSTGSRSRYIIEKQRRRCSRGPRNARSQEKTCRISCVPCGAHVLLHGTHDVELAAPAVL